MTTEARYWVRFPPGGTSQIPDSFCVADGWPADAAAVFQKESFEILVLQSFNGADIDIPPLGDAALQVRELILQANGRINGLEQFKNVESIFEGFFPKSGLDPAVFLHLKRVKCNYEKGAEWIFSCPGIAELYIENLAETDCQKLGSVRGLRRLFLDGGA